MNHIHRQSKAFAVVFLQFHLNNKLVKFLFVYLSVYVSGCLFIRLFYSPHTEQVHI